MIPDARARIVATERAIRPHLRRTPVVQVSGAELGLEDRLLTLKLELLQHAGAFKTRGAFSNLLQRPVPPAGVVAASGGNHGVAVAHATNVFRRTDDGWRMILHHASPAPVTVTQPCSGMVQ